MFGLSAPTLLHEGHLVPTALVLSHSEQRERLRHGCPEALPAAVVAGDPSYDRILAGRAWRASYRDSLDVGDRELVLVTSTWGPSSLLARCPWLLPRLLRELPVDEYRVVLAAHPNVWHAHGAWQVRSWLASCERAGLLVLPPRVGWQGALVAADHVIGDHGSVTFYGAALGTHTMLATFPHDELDPASPIAEFGRAAHMLDDDRHLAAQLAEDADLHRPDRFAACTRLLTSLPGQSGGALRSLFYEMLGLPEPDTRSRTLPPEPPEPYRPTWPHRAPTGPLTVTVAGDAAEVRLERYPAELVLDSDPPLVKPHLLVDADEPDPYWRSSADILVRRSPQPARPTGWIAEALEAHPACRIAAVLEGDRCVVGTRGGTYFGLRVEGFPLDTAVSAFWRVHAEGADLSLPTTVKLHLGRGQAALRIDPLPE